MKPALMMLLATGAAVADPALVQTMDTTNFPVVGKIHRLDPALDALLDPAAKIEVIASGFEWTEGPVWVPVAADGPAGGHVLFSEIPSNSVHRWDEGKGLSVFLKASGYTGPGQYSREPGSNGLVLDATGRLISCEHGDRRISMLTDGGGKRTLADNFQGRRFNSPNDACIKSNGDIYFTDPPYGLPKGAEDPLRELDICGVYRLDAKSREVTLLTDRLSRPNGIAFSPDEKTIYVAQSDPKAATWTAFPVSDDGKLGEGRVFSDATAMVAARLKGLPDGLKVDRAGHLWATGPGGVHVMSPSGKLLGRLEVGESTSNCAFGGADGTTLFITADMYVCRIKTKTTGAAAGLVRR